MKAHKYFWNSSIYCIRFEMYKAFHIFPCYLVCIPSNPMGHPGHTHHMFHDIYYKCWDQSRGRNFQDRLPRSAVHLLRSGSSHMTDSPYFVARYMSRRWNDNLYTHHSLQKQKRKDKFDGSLYYCRFHFSTIIACLIKMHRAIVKNVTCNAYKTYVMRSSKMSLKSTKIEFYFLAFAICVLFKL